MYAETDENREVFMLFRFCRPAAQRAVGKSCDLHRQRLKAFVDGPKALPRHAGGALCYMLLSSERFLYEIGRLPQTKFRRLQEPVQLRFITLPLALEASIIVPLPI